MLHVWHHVLCNCACTAFMQIWRMESCSCTYVHTVLVRKAAYGTIHASLLELDQGYLQKLLHVLSHHGACAIHHDADVHPFLPGLKIPDDRAHATGLDT